MVKFGIREFHNCVTYAEWNAKHEKMGSMKIQFELRNFLGKQLQRTDTYEKEEWRR